MDRLDQFNFLALQCLVDRDALIGMPCVWPVPGSRQLPARSSRIMPRRSGFTRALQLLRIDEPPVIVAFAA
jgi:hypothetical protein